ncbi:hypothetical protein D7X94_05410 [Acutalibacter sp. 1XD8-33]|nr:hypothetical protein D7X94_05410 [Acutalibacter sp. 1XD8-33]
MSARLEDGQRGKQIFLFLLILTQNFQKYKRGKRFFLFSFALVALATDDFTNSRLKRKKGCDLWAR